MKQIQVSNIDSIKFKERKDTGYIYHKGREYSCKTFFKIRYSEKREIPYGWGEKEHTNDKFNSVFCPYFLRLSNDKIISCKEYLLDNDKVYYKAKVIIKLPSENIILYFNTDYEAMIYIEHIKDKKWIKII